jgi:hypothetical protein
MVAKTSTLWDFPFCIWDTFKIFSHLWVKYLWFCTENGNLRERDPSSGNRSLASQPGVESQKAWKVLSFGTLLCLNLSLSHSGGVFHLCYSTAYPCTLFQSGYPSEDKSSKDGGRERERSPSPIILCHQSVFLASQMTYKVLGSKT